MSGPQAGQPLRRDGFRFREMRERPVMARKTRAVAAVLPSELRRTEATGSVGYLCMGQEAAWRCSLRMA
jgi:hypothetical protein